MAYSNDEQREIEKRAAQAATQAESKQKSGCLIFFIVLFVLGVIVGGITKAVGGESIGDGGVIAMLVVAIVATILIVALNKKKTMTAVNKVTQQVKSVQETRRHEMDEVFSSAKNEGFVFSKTVINPINTACLALDSSREEFLVKDSSCHKMLKYNQLVSYELCKDGSSYISGDASGAIMGGLLFGTVGAVAGAAGSSKSVNQYCSEMYISVVDDTAHRYKLSLVSEPILEASYDYKVAIERAREMLSILNVIDNANKKSRAQFASPAKSVDSSVKLIDKRSTSDSESNERSESKANNAVFSEADEIAKFRALADKGIITDEEFEAKKKQLLGL